MKKALVLTSLAALAAVSFGCVLTDYPPMGVHNKSHGVIGCSSDDRIANSQQTIEGDTRGLLYTTTFGGPSLGGFCTTGFDPGVSLVNVSTQDARDWNRFNADYVFFGEVQVFGTGPFTGTWIMAGGKDLADGSTRLNTYYRTAATAFSCVGSSVDGRYGGPEGVIVADGLTRLPGLHLETIAIDSVAGSEFCPNIAAVEPSRAANGYSTYWSFLVRGGEGRLAATPITRRAGGLAQFLQGAEPMTVSVSGIDATLRGALNADGSISFDVTGLSANGVSYQAEQALRLTANPANHFRTWKVENLNDAELVRMADWAIQSGTAGRTISLADQVVPELGIKLPPVELLISEDTLRRFVAGELPGVDGEPGFGG